MSAIRRGNLRSMWAVWAIVIVESVFFTSWGWAEAPTTEAVDVWEFTDGENAHPRSVVSDTLLDAALDHTVTLHVASGTAVTGTILRYSSERIIVLRDDGELVDLDRGAVTRVQWREGAATDNGNTAPPSAISLIGEQGEDAPFSSFEDLRDEWAKEMQLYYRYRRVGAGKRVFGSILVGTGTSVAYVGLLLLLIRGVHNIGCEPSRYDDCNLRDAYRPVVVTTIVGSVILAAGVPFIVVANKQRRTVMRDARRRLQLSVAPALMHDGGGMRWSLTF